jgi:2-methylisocitrate lyase-like PEP mutase family enzyme
MPNPWDRGTARYFAHLGFPALATTSAGYAFGLGLPDAAGAVMRDDALAHIRTIVDATPLPVNADFEAGYADSPEGVAESVRLCAAAGAAGLSIEDATGRRDAPLYGIETAVARLRAAKAALAAHAPDVILTARAECFLTGHPDPLRESIRRLTAYAEAGADVLYAPGLSTREEISAVVQAVAPKPVNVLMSRAAGLTVADLAGLGVRRISLGSALARVAWGAVMRAADEIAREGRFDGLSGAVPFGEINAFFMADQGMAKPADT